MDSLLILIPIALLFTIVAVGAYLWAVNSGQYDDLDRAASDILFDEEPQEGDDKAQEPAADAPEDQP